MHILTEQNSLCMTTMTTAKLALNNPYYTYILSNITYSSNILTISKIAPSLATYVTQLRLHICMLDLYIAYIWLIKQNIYIVLHILKGQQIHFVYKTVINLYRSCLLNRCGSTTLFISWYDQQGTLTWINPCINTCTAYFFISLYDQLRSISRNT